MHRDFEACYRAISSRDPRFDGRFVTGVVTTGIYCRPVCPAPLPRRENVRFHPTAAAAARAGLRPCRRCRPDRAPAGPPVPGGSPEVRRALRMIDAGFLDGNPVSALAAATHLSERQLRRAFAAELGATPRDIARARRAHLARVLLEASGAPVAEVALAAGYRSLRRFNAEVRATFGAPPRALRRGRAAGGPASGHLALRIAYRPPLDMEALLGFLAPRAVAGVEEVVGGVYRRVAGTAAGPRVVTLRPEPARRAVVLEAPADAHAEVAALAARARRLLDLDADPLAVAEALGADPLLGPRVRVRPGLRVPGAWDPFEGAVRAVLGQQVSVAAATGLAGRLAARAGAPLAAPDGGLRRAFPDPAAVAAADLDRLGLTAGRARALRTLAERVRDGALVLDPARDPADVREELLAIPGVGPWTADYVALRALRDPDAFPDGDLGVRRALGDGDGPCTAAAARERAAAWRPWRAYATLHLWTGG
ncbi:MAG TPA: AlkA N-terminal domain-containing protein [Miltoncostaeaceae bacterium]|nr:AlkA N-terminal domain-containing protein [Miltoncostaeaceae bacterium]